MWNPFLLNVSFQTELSSVVPTAWKLFRTGSWMLGYRKGICNTLYLSTQVNFKCMSNIHLHLHRKLYLLVAFSLYCHWFFYLFCPMMSLLFSYLSFLYQWVSDLRASKLFFSFSSWFLKSAGRMR